MILDQHLYVKMYTPVITHLLLQSVRSNKSSHDLLSGWENKLHVSHDGNNVSEVLLTLLYVVQIMTQLASSRVVECTMLSPVVGHCNYTLMKNTSTTHSQPSPWTYSISVILVDVSWKIPQVPSVYCYEYHAVICLFSDILNGNLWKCVNLQKKKKKQTWTDKM